VTTIRAEAPGEQAAVAVVVGAAFGRPSVVRLVELIRRSPEYEPGLSFVAVDGDGRIVGHVLFSRAPLRREGADDASVLMLSPLSVHPDRQRQGIGSALVRHGLDVVNARGEPLVILEGAPALYRRFGFRPASEVGIARPSARIPESAFQVRLLDGYDPALVGTVDYPKAFWDTGSVGPS
jgi:putative acetyltransferase